MAGIVRRWLRTQPFEYRADFERSQEVLDNVEASTVRIEAELERVWHAEGEPARRARRRIGLRIESDGDRPIIRFVDVPGGDEVFDLDDVFVESLVDAAGGRMTVRSPLSGREGCTVDVDDVAAFVSEARPDLLPAAGPSGPAF